MNLSRILATIAPPERIEVMKRRSDCRDGPRHRAVIRRKARLGIPWMLTLAW